jgi:hypothetical protein
MYLTVDIGKELTSPVHNQTANHSLN